MMGGSNFTHLYNQCNNIKDRKEVGYVQFAYWFKDYPRIQPFSDALEEEDWKGYENNLLARNWWHLFGLFNSLLWIRVFLFLRRDCWSRWKSLTGVLGIYFSFRLLVKNQNFVADDNLVEKLLTFLTMTELFAPFPNDCGMIIKAFNHISNVRLLIEYGANSSFSRSVFCWSGRFLF